ncbi:hypothetical protein ACV4WP_16660 [Pseudomonas aeruginosa]|uniref:hypothetical protein n=1 Tax=Pseudomonas aeruginosa TaxID=287 RepID=UPI001245C118|nr:hypothetical protein [Pseudomonas aeruginosa]KAB0772290.1 hypothetical protein F7P00_25755 [Pseudomonas aeruginosa]
MAEDKVFNIPGDLAFIEADNIPGELLPAWQRPLRDESEISKVKDNSEEFFQKVQDYQIDDLLGLSAFYSLVKGVFSERDASYPEPSDLELLQGIALVGARRGGKKYLPREFGVSELWGELSRQNYVLSCSDEQSRANPLDHMATVHTAYYRNPYGDDFFDRMVLAVTSEYDKRYIRNGTFAQMGELIVNVRKTIWGRFQSYFSRMGKTLRMNRKKLIRELKSIYGDKIDPEFIRACDGLDVDQLRAKVYNCLEDDAVQKVFRLDGEWVALCESGGYPVVDFLQKLSLESIDGYDSIESLISTNSISCRPFIKTDNGYSIYCLLTMMSFPFSVLLTLLGSGEEEKNRLEKVRGWFVEVESHRMLSQAFPSAKVAMGGYWFREEGHRVESDLIVLLSTHVLIFEAKGAVFPERVRSGNPGAAKQFLRKIWGKSTRQSGALARKIKETDEPIRIVDAKGDLLLEIESKKITTISRFSVSVEQVGVLMNAPRILKEMGVLDEAVDPAPCIILSELGMVLKSLKSELACLHYLTRRAGLCLQHQIIGDEMDIFAIYLQSSFSHFPESEATMMILGASDYVREYCSEGGTFSIPPRSSLNNSPYFDGLLRYMRSRLPHVYFNAGLLVMDTPFGHQMEFEKEMRRNFVGMPSKGDSPVAFTHVKSTLGQFVICATYMDPRLDVEVRRNMAMNALAHVGSQHNVKEGLIFVRLAGSSVPYDALYFGGSTVNSR